MTESPTASVLAVSYLFVPASRPERFEKALATDAGAVIVDLEDAVPIAEKDTALEALEAAFATGLSRPVHLRINAADSAWFDRDLAALGRIARETPDLLAGVMVPKTESPAELIAVRTALGDRGGYEILALIESAVGLDRLRDLAATPGLSRFAVGAADLSVDLDVEIASSTVDWAYAQLVVASRLAGLPGPIASPTFEIRDLDVVRAEALRLRGLGASGQLSIHPGQLAAINEGFLPDAESIAWAKRVSAAGPDGAQQVDGQMVDKPVWERAQRILSRARSVD